MTGRPGRSRPVVLDTDVCSLVLKGRLDPATASRLHGAAWAVSFVTVGERWRWAESRKWGTAARGRLRRWLSAVDVIDSDEPVSRCWAQIMAFADQRGRRRPVNDAWIAACCITDGVAFVTRNVKDFVDFAEHEGLELIPV